MSQQLAACDRVAVVYGRGDSAVRALDGVDLAIERRDSFALLGRSGSGKTTLLHVFGGLVEPTVGTVTWHGQPLVSLDRAGSTEGRPRGISYVFQGANLLPSFTAFENVAFAAWAAAGETDPELAPLTLLELVGLGGKVDNLPSELSGGEAQRVAIARSLAQEPELLLCDEPTGHLDTDTGERMLDLLTALQREFGFALVVATHDPHVGARFDRAIELHDGRIVADEVAA